MRTFNLALVVPPRSALQRALVDTVWPIWEVLFRDCKVPCDEHGAGGSGADVGVRLIRLERVAAPEGPLQGIAGRP